MDYELILKPTATQYYTREQLYALCVLLCWKDGLNLSNLDGRDTVTLMSRDKGNTGLSAYLLETNPNAKNVNFTDDRSTPYCPIFFEVLGVRLQAEFDEDGVGTVIFPEQPIADSL
jgi:hypothetical protein